MSVTIFGVLVIVVGCWLLLRGTPLDLLVFVLVATLFGGSAAITLSTGSSIQPATLAVLFLALRCVLPRAVRPEWLVAGLRANAALIIFTLYGLVGAFTLPFIFAGAIDVTPLRPIITHDPFSVFPLAFSPQNVTSAGYLLTTMLGAIGAFVATRSKGADEKIVTVLIALALIHTALGFASLFAAGTPLAIVFEFFRNGNYNQLNQEIGGLSRMNGIFAEASNYAGYATFYLVAMTELWLRGIRSRATGFAAVGVFAALIVSTSSSGYVGVLGYASLLTLRQLIVPQSIPLPKLLAILGVAVIGLTGAVALAVFSPEFLLLVQKIYTTMIAEKAQSISGMVRLMWAKQGIEAFRVSGGLGVGVGSFRSSSLATAILGSMGVIGIVSYVVQMILVMKPLRRSTYVATGNLPRDLSAAMAWVVVVVAVPAFVAAPSPDPGLNWGLFVGMSLGLERLVQRQPARAGPASDTSATPYLRAIV